MVSEEALDVTGWPCPSCLGLNTTHYAEMGPICHDCGHVWGDEVVWLLSADGDGAAP